MSTNASVAPNRRRLSTRIGSLFAAKQTHISDFYIDLDEPHKQYTPGDQVTGRVVLKVAKPLGITHVVVSLYGYVQVFKNHSALKDTVRNLSKENGRKGTRWAPEYYGDGFASLFEEEVVLCGDGRLDPQRYHFQFSLSFPTTLRLPSSIDVSASHHV